jgi:hypothetical protein
VPLNIVQPTSAMTNRFWFSPDDPGNPVHACMKDGNDMQDGMIIRV